jgi:hypothetical protein
MDYGNQQSSRGPWIRLVSLRATCDTLGRDGSAGMRRRPDPLSLSDGGPGAEAYSSRRRDSHGSLQVVDRQAGGGRGRTGAAGAARSALAVRDLAGRDGGGGQAGERRARPGRTLPAMPSESLFDRAGGSVFNRRPQAGKSRGWLCACLMTM